MGKTIRENLDKLIDEIDNYNPPTKWEEANGRMLKSLKKKKKALEYAVEREQKRKRQEV